MKAHALLEHLILQESLSPQQMQDVITACVQGEYNDVQIATFLALMRTKGETVAELTAAAQAMQRLAHTIDLQVPAIDIVGTGGDGKNTFNVSTAASFVVAGCGIPVAKHGSRSVSSRSGAADVLELAGFQLQLTEAQLRTCIQACHLVFLYAPHFHPAMQSVLHARQQLGIRTFFNVLGPLINPARVRRQVVGVYSHDWLRPVAQVLSHLGSERTLVVNGDDGLDEISIAAPTHVMEWRDGGLHAWVLHPKDYGLQHKDLTHVVVDSAQQSLQRLLGVLDGQAGAARDMVLLNAAAAIYCAQDGLSFEAAIEAARASIDSGRARHCFDALKLLTHTVQEPSYGS